MLTGEQIVAALDELQFTHVVWLPDSVIGQWEAALESAPRIRLLRVCREGEAWTVAAGLHLGGKQPLVMIQTTGLFESGDALRSVLFDMRLPIPALIGYRSYLNEGSTDSARHFAEPILRAWGLDYLVVNTPAELPQMIAHYRNCRAANKPAIALLAEGRM